jgi:hypothetical protein
MPGPGRARRQGAGNERKRDAADDESCCGRHANAPRNKLKAHHDSHQQKNEFEPRDRRHEPVNRIC